MPRYGTVVKKTIVKPLDRPFARAVAVETSEYTRVYLAGAVADSSDGDLEQQTRETLETLRGYLEALGGDVSDFVRVRVYLNCDLPSEAYAQVNAAREGFFTDHHHYPASTAIQIAGLVSDDLDIEIDAEAIIPHDDWEVEIIE